MKFIFAPICFVLLLCVGPTALGQAEKTNLYAERKPIDWFYEAANYHSDTLLLKSLQFTAPYSGHYYATSVESNGNVFTGLKEANWFFSGVKASGNGTLDAALLSLLRMMLAQLHFPSAEAPLEPEPGELHTAFVYFDGSAYRRLNFNGEIPAEIDSILEIIRREIIAAGRLREEQFIAHRKLMEETYGDWKNRDGITVPASSRSHGFEDNHGLLLGLLGQRKASPTAQPAAVSIYHALVFYPGGGVTGGGSGTNWSDDPVLRQGVTWTMPNPEGSYDKKYQHELEIEHDAIDETIKIKGETYYLSRGNLFVIRMREDWTPAVIQLNDRLDQVAPEQNVLDRFKSIMTNDGAIQRLEFVRQSGNH